MYVSIDSTDCSIEEPRPFSSSWYSLKLHGSGLSYEIGICIESGEMVWDNSPFQCGQQNDLQIFHHFLNEKLSNERVMADRIYRHPNCVNPRMYTMIRCQKIFTKDIGPDKRPLIVDAIILLF